MSVRVEIEKLRPFDLLQTGDMTFGELEELVRISGMDPIPCDEARLDYNPRAWRAILTVSYRRVEPDIDEFFWDERGTTLGQIVEGVRQAAEDAIKKAKEKQKAEGKKKRPPRQGQSSSASK